MQIHYEGPFNTWNEAACNSTGYDSELILESVLNTTLKVIDGKFIYERDSVGFKENIYEWQMCSAIYRSLLSHSGKFSVLDFGGSLGSRYFQHRSLLNEYEIEWNIIEQKNYVYSANKFIHFKNLNFFSSIDEFKKSKKVDFILLSSVLQYLSNPSDIISQLIKLKPKHIFVDRTYVSTIHEFNRIYIQSNELNHTKSSYPFHLFSENILMKYFSNYKKIFDFKANYSTKDISTIDGELKGYYFSVP